MNAPGAPNSRTSEASTNEAATGRGPSSGDCTKQHQVVIIGGGVAGTAAAVELKTVSGSLDVALIEPSAFHYDQPAWMRVGIEGLAKERTRHAEAPRVPAGVAWIRDQATAIDPEAQVVMTARGERIHYGYLVVAVGVKMLWDRIRGLEGALGTHGICSVYGYDEADQAWEMIRAFRGGRAFFTTPSGPFKGGEAPLSLLHRADALWRKTGAREKTELFFVTAGSAAFGGPEYAEMVERDAQEKDVHVYFGYELIEVRPANREAVFSVIKGETQSRDVLRYDLLHVVPPMRPPEVVETSELAYPSGPMRGYLEIYPDTFQHKRYSNVFGIGDAAGLPIVKTGAQARAQAPLLARNLQRAMKAER